MRQTNKGCKKIIYLLYSTFAIDWQSITVQTIDMNM